MKRNNLIIAMLMVLALTVIAAVPICTGYSIVMQEANHLNETDVRWDYLITATSGKDISHVTVAVPACYEVIDCGPEPCERGLDPTTGIDGVKWDVEILTGESAVFWFVTRTGDGQTRHGDVEAAIKAGPDVCRYEVDGPTCYPNAVTLIALTAQQKNNAVRNGVIYALIVAVVVIAIMYVLNRRPR